MCPTYLYPFYQKCTMRFLRFVLACITLYERGTVLEPCYLEGGQLPNIPHPTLTRTFIYKNFRHSSFPNYCISLFYISHSVELYENVKSSGEGRGSNLHGIYIRVVNFRKFDMIPKWLFVIILQIIFS